ncbi:MAG TPA: hypothetical protein VI733_01730 [Candidatus Limnocylindria bacterium]|nr:hypothetical protein [Candidatus Limnocylindria bacterium]
MNWRAVGCGTLAIVVFLAVGLYGMSLAFNRLDGCPERLQWGDRGYLPDGAPAAEPSFAEGSPVEIGSTFIGLTTRQVWGPPGSAPSDVAADRPDRIVLDCDDGTVQAYRFAGATP